MMKPGKLNIENIKKTIEALKTTESYDQTLWYHICGTPGCITGHAIFSCTDYGILNCQAVIDSHANFVNCIDDILTDIFNVSKYQCDLITDQNPLKGPTATAEDAIRMLEGLIETGTVNWARPSE